MGRDWSRSVIKSGRADVAAYIHARTHAPLNTRELLLAI
jgi:hypothetical protein